MFEFVLVFVLVLVCALEVCSSCILSFLLLIFVGDESVRGGFRGKVLEP